MWQATDPDGRRVVLTFRRWRHIVERHPELAHERDAIISVVERPVERRPGREPHEEWFYGRGLGPGHWLRVVVHYDEGVGSITTAFPRRDLP